MAIILFDGEGAIHEIPKCASDYIARVLEHNKISFNQTHLPGRANPRCCGIQNIVMGAGSSHCIPDDSPFYQIAKERNNVICFVRHPLKWLMSWWKYAEEHIQGLPDKPGKALARSWKPTSRFDADCCSRDFNDFIDLVIAEFPGVVTEFFNSYIEESNHVGRVEEIDKTLKHYIAWTLQENIKTDIPRTNTTSINAFYTKAQAEKILELEHDLVRYFQYDYIPGGSVE